MKNVCPILSCRRIVMVMENGLTINLFYCQAVTGKSCAYGFVFLHPFEDGNGRIHRFLIHNILSPQGMVPPGLMLPVTAVMLKNPADYDASLEAFTRPLLGFIDYHLDETGQMTVENDTACWYQLKNSLQ